MNIIILLVLLLIIYIIYSYVYKIIRFSKNNNLKGPSFIPILGNLHQLGALPHRTLHEMSSIYGKTFKLWLGDYYTIVLSDPKLVKAAMIKNSDNFVNKIQHPTMKLFSLNNQSLVGARDELWHHNRKLVAPSFAKNKIRNFSNAFDKQTDYFMIMMSQYEKTGQPFPTSKYCKIFSLNLIFSVVYSESISYEEGINEGKFTRLMEMLDFIVNNAAAGALVDYIKIVQPFYSAYKSLTGSAMDPIYNLISTIYDEHLETIDYESPRDLMDYLIIDSEGKNKVGVVAVTIDMLIASESSSAAIDWLLLAMANNPDVQEKIWLELKNAVGIRGKVSMSTRANTPYLNATLMEVLRMRSAIAIPREAKESVWLDDSVYIPKGAHIVVNYYGMSKSDRWDEPDKFKPERFLNGEDKFSDFYFPYGAGPRNCIGMNLANEEMYIALGNILSNFKISPHAGKKLEEVESPGLIVKPQEYMLKLEQRV